MLKLGRIKHEHARRVAVLMVVASVALLLLLTRHLSFAGDEWDFILGSQNLSVASIFAPHNGHWVTIPLLVYQLLLRLVGLHAYWPYMLVVLALHGLIALLIFSLIARRHGNSIALAAVPLVIFFGNGADDLLSSWEIAFTGAAALGLVAILLVDRPDEPRWRVCLAALALIASIMCSGVGLFFVAAVGVELLADRRRWKYLWVVLPPAIVFVVWFILEGSRGPGLATGTTLGQLGLGGLLTATAYLGVGLTATAAALVGVPHQLAIVPVGAAILVGFVVVGVIAGFRRGRVDSRVLGAVAGLLVQFLLTGLVRQQLGLEQARSSRYIYVAAIFGALIAADLAAAFWRRRAVRRALAVLLLLSVVANAALLAEVLVDREDKVEFQHAELQTVEFFRGQPDISLDGGVDADTLGNVTPRGFYAATDRWGSPVRPVTLDGLRRLPARATERTVTQLLGPAVRVFPAPSAASATGCTDVALETGRTATITSAGGRAVALDFAGGSEVNITLWALSAQDASLKLAFFKYPYSIGFALPDLGHGLDWHFDLAARGPNHVRSCPTSPP